MGLLVVWTDGGDDGDSSDDSSDDARFHWPKALIAGRRFRKKKKHYPAESRERADCGESIKI